MPRLFQNFDVYPRYLQVLHARTRGADFDRFRAAFMADRFIALHMLKPTIEGSANAAFAIGGDPVSQRKWARARGLKRRATPEQILLAQIEEHGTEIFYNHDPVRFDSAFVRRLPGCVRTSIAWRAAPSGGGDFGAYDRVVCNFPSILEAYRARGWRTAWFAPGHDPEMDAYAATRERPTDILFVGTYSRHHRRRADLIARVARLADRFRVRLHLYPSRLTLVAETIAGAIGPLRKHRRPPEISRIAEGPVFGRDLYAAIGAARIVINGAIDMAGPDRGNMRCWETLGCGAMMLSDEGSYPDGMENGRTFAAYRSVEDLAGKAEAFLADEEARRTIAEAGNALVRSRYGKDRQWRDFLELV